MAAHGGGQLGLAGWPWPWRGRPTALCWLSWVPVTCQDGKAVRLAEDGCPWRRTARPGRGQRRRAGSTTSSWSAYMNPKDREHIQDLIAAAGGQILEGSNLPLLREKLDKNPVKPYFIYDGGAPREFAPSSFLDLHKEIEEGIEYAGRGAQVISHLRVFDAIAVYDAQVLNHKDHFTRTCVRE